MLRNKLDRSAGFGIVGVVVVMLAVLVLGFVAWRIYDANQKPHTSTSTPTAVGTNDTSLPTASESDPNEGYVVIEQWGVRFKPVEGLGEVEYFKPRDMPYDAFTFTTKVLADASPTCASTSGNIIQGMLYRNKEQQPASGEVFAKIGDYYYQFRGPDSTCGAGNDQLEVDSLMQLKQSLRSLEAAK